LWFASWGTAGYIVLALIGGFILNLMPCVLPVISIKVLSFVQQAREDRLRVFTLGTAFAAGIEVSFIALGFLIIGLGQQWGGLFQTPQLVIALAAIVTALALSLFGVFSLHPPRIVGQIGRKVQPEGHLSAFAMGLLATVLGTACTAPFLSAVIAIAIKQPPATGMFIFAVAGLGMALPYVLLAAKPAWVKLVPRPGPWMTTFEHVVGFVLLATVVWLLNPLVAQLGGSGLLWTLVFLLFVAFAAWLYGKVEFGAPRARKVRIYGAALLLVVGGWLLCFHAVHTIPELVAAERARRFGAMASDPARLDWSAGSIPWVPYARDKAMKLARQGYTVFIDYTAEWCINCKTNEKLVIRAEPVRRTLRRLGVVPMKADYTSYDPVIKEDLARYGRAGVPMYVILPAGRPEESILLDELLTVDSLIAALNRAGPSTASARAISESDAP